MADDATTRVGEASVHWRRAGSGPPIVFLHGFPLSGATVRVGKPELELDGGRATVTAER